MLVMSHATPLYRAYIEVRRTNFLQSMLSPPLSLFSATQRTCGAHHLFAHMRPHMSVKTQEDPLNLPSFTSTCWWWKTNPIKIFGGRFWSYSRVVRFYLQFNPRCISRGFNLSTTTLFSFMTRPRCWMSHVSSKGGRTRPNLRLCSRIRLVVLT